MSWSFKKRGPCGEMASTHRMLILCVTTLQVLQVHGSNECKLFRGKFGAAEWVVVVCVILSVLVTVLPTILILRLRKEILGLREKLAAHPCAKESEQNGLRPSSSNTDAQTGTKTAKEPKATKPPSNIGSENPGGSPSSAQDEQTPLTTTPQKIRVMVTSDDVGRKSPKAVMEPKVDVDQLAKELASFYLKHNPDKLPTVAAIVKDFKMRGGGVAELRWLDKDLKKLYGEGLPSLTAPAPAPALRQQTDPGHLYATRHNPNAPQESQFLPSRIGGVGLLAQDATIDFAEIAARLSTLEPAVSENPAANDASLLGIHRAMDRTPAPGQFGQAIRSSLLSSQMNFPRHGSVPNVLHTSKVDVSNDMSILHSSMLAHLSAQSPSVRHAEAPLRDLQWEPRRRATARLDTSQARRNVINIHSSLDTYHGPGR
eukprot:1689001-Rhodomonas_salina.2